MFVTIFFVTMFCFVLFLTMFACYLHFPWIYHWTEWSEWDENTPYSQQSYSSYNKDNDCNKVKTCRPRIHLWDSGCNRRYSEELLTETFHEVKGNVSGDIHSSIYVRLAVFQRWERGVHGVERNYSPWHLEIVTLEITDRTFWMQFTPEEFGR